MTARRLAIGLVTPGFSASDEDWCIPALHDLVSALAREHDVYVLALRYPHRRGTYRACGATVEALAAAERRGPARLPMLWQAIAALRRQHRRRPLDVLHGLWAHEPGFLVTAAGPWFGVPTVVSILGGELVGLPDIGYGGQLSAANRWLVGRALDRADAVTVGSLALERMAAASVPSNRLYRIPLGVDVARFTPAASDAERMALAGRPAILHVASLSAVKDQAMLLQAYARARQGLPGAHLHLVGDGDLRAVLESLAGRLGLTPHVTFHGAVPHDALPRYYRGADACVLSSRFESQCMVVLEAAACGCQTMGTAVGMLPEIAGPGAVVEPGDAAGLAGLIVSAWGPEATRPKPAVSPAQLVATCSVDTMVTRLDALYRSVASRRGRVGSS